MKMASSTLFCAVVNDCWSVLPLQMARMATQHSDLTSCSRWGRWRQQTPDYRLHMVGARAQSRVGIKWQTWHGCREMPGWRASAVAALVLTTAGSTFSCLARVLVFHSWMIPVHHTSVKLLTIKLKSLLGYWQWKASAKGSDDECA